MVAQRLRGVKPAAASCEMLYLVLKPFASLEPDRLPLPRPDRLSPNRRFEIIRHATDRINRIPQVDSPSPLKSTAYCL